MTISSRLVGWIWDRRWMIIAACALATLVAGWQATKVGVDNSLRVWFVEDDPQLVSYRRFQASFGSDEVVVIAWQEPAGFMTGQRLELVQRVQAMLRGIDGVGGVEPVSSLDGSTAALVVRMAALEDIDQRRDRILARIDGALAALGVPTHKAGVGVLYAALNQLAIVDAAVLFGAAWVLIFGLLWMAFRRLMPALVTLAVAGTATVWMLGLYGAAGKNLNMVTTAMPTLILVIGVAECVHLLLHVAQQPPGASRRERVVSCVAFTLRPSLLNALTTVGGFLSLAVSPLPVVRDLGLFAAAGIAGCFVLTIAGCTFALAWERCEPRSGTLAKGTQWATRAAFALGETGIRYPRATLAAGAMLVAAALIAVARVQMDTYTIDFLFPDHPVRRDSAFIEQRLGPYMPIEFVVSAAGGKPTAELLDSIERWQKTVIEESGAKWSRSLGDVPAIAWLDAPRSQAQIDAAIQTYRAAQNAGAMPLVDAEGRLRVTFGVAMQSARSAARTAQAILDSARLPPGANVVVSGYVPLYVRMVDYVVNSQVQSFALAMVVVFGVIGLAFGSVRAALLAIPSNVVPMVLILGTMGLAGIRLDVATVTIASIVLGLVVDDTVPALYKLSDQFERHRDHERALRAMIATTGPAILSTSLVMTLGFSVFALAEIKSIIYFGLLIGLGMLSSVLADLLFLPALVTWLRPDFVHARRMRSGEEERNPRDGSENVCRTD
jgi:predicted RND superfamily exporter protein